MAVVGIAIGAGVISTIVYNNHSDHSDYSDYNYSDYSDAAERRRRRIDAKNSEIQIQESKVNTYKSSSVNEYLQSEALKQQSGVTVNITEVKRDGDAKLNGDMNVTSQKESADYISEIDKINNVINRIDKILEEGE